VGSALVVGDTGSGLTTFVGLLYTAQLRLGTEAADEFRFSADRASIRELETIYGELASGRFPERDVNWEEHPLSFVFGFSRGWTGALRPRDPDGEREFDSVRIQVGGISAQEIAELAQYDAVLEESTRRLLRSPVVLPLVDASRLALLPEGGPPSALARYDRLLSATLAVVAGFVGAERDRRSRRMYPIFVVTKFDRCSRETLVGLDAPDGLPNSWTPPARVHFGHAILERFLPLTERFLYDSDRDSPTRVDPPRWYFSGLDTAPGPHGTAIARRSRLPVGGWEPEYPFEEYRALIRELGRLARRLRDGELAR
jgi:hypothetical protein